MIHVRIASLSIDSTSNQPVIVLRPIEDEPGHGRLVPIWIGNAEASAILLALQGVEPPRPMTHDLLAGILGGLDATLDRVEIERLHEGTFYANLVLSDGERVVRVDARPSDSIALAIRTRSPIFVDESVVDAAAIPETDQLEEEDEIERFRDFLDHIEPSDFLES